jgi:hypothetical protein
VDYLISRDFGIGSDYCIMSWASPRPAVSLREAAEAVLVAYDRMEYQGGGAAETFQAIDTKLRSALASAPTPGTKGEVKLDGALREALKEIVQKEKSRMFNSCPDCDTTAIFDPKKECSIKSKVQEIAESALSTPTPEAQP